MNSRTFYQEKNVGQDNNNGVYINNFKTSLLRSQARLSLAIHTLIELFFLFSILYFIDCSNPKTPLHALLYSLGIGVFNVSFSKHKFIIFELIHIGQVLLSVILILLSIAQYLGSNGELNKEDQVLYRDVQKLKKTPAEGRILSNRQNIIVGNLHIITDLSTQVEYFQHCIHISKPDKSPIANIINGICTLEKEEICSIVLIDNNIKEIRTYV